MYDEAKRFAEALDDGVSPRARRPHAHRPHLQHLRPAHAPARRPRAAEFHLPGAPRRGPHRLRRRLADALVHLCRRHLSGILKLLESDEAEPVNIGNPQEISIAEFARLLIEITGSRSRIVTLPFPPEFKDDPKVRQPDISKARKVLGWEPRYAIRDGLVPTLEYFRKRMER